MTQWHADIDEATMAVGVKLTVLSQHHVVRLITADTLSIQDTSGQRLSALVVRRTAGDLSLLLEDGRAFSLEMHTDESLQPPGVNPDTFSRQVWLTH
ncbi:MAG: hypothetical protein EOP22_14905 [Hyphomicrobiales bacterium]|nr:MAG: hypothetical protein EOP22_14905 [Hyphomicrobiales bacterium]